MATVAAHGLLVALRTAGEVRDDGRARKTDRGVGVRLEVGEERLDVRAGDLLEVDSLGLKSVVSMQGEQTTEQRQLTDWTELQHWRSPVLQELTGPACALYVSVENLGWSKRGRAHDLRASHDGGGGEGNNDGDAGEHGEYNER